MPYKRSKRPRSSSIRDGFVNSKKLLLIAGLALVSVVVIVLLFMPFNTSPKLNTTSVSKDSNVIQTTNTTTVSMQGYNSYLYKTNNTGKDAALEFIQRDPQYNASSIIPKDFAQNTSITRSEDDNNDPFLKRNNVNITNQHFFFDQKINNIPVYGATLTIHLRNGNEIYAVQGNLVKNNTIQKQVIPLQKAKERALQSAYAEAPQAESLSIKDSEKYILNKKILGIADDDTNYTTLAVTVKNKTQGKTKLFSTRYFIDLVSGTVVYKQELVHNLAGKRIIDCRPDPCKIARSEGQAPIGDEIVDTLYDQADQVTDWYYQRFYRDGMDGRGGMINFHLAPATGEENGMASFNEIIIDADSIYPNNVDVIAHEMTHSVTSALNILQVDQSLNEGTSDIFSYFMRDVWFTETSKKEVLRDAVNPTGMKDPHPDKLFSEHWSCDGDYYQNTTVIEHAVYLIAKGGTSNGCTVSALGIEATANIEYQALTKYLVISSNMKDYYTAMLNACNDFYGTTPAVCEQVKGALMAVELDQQPIGTIEGPKCITGKTEVIPTCPNTPLSSTIIPPPTYALPTHFVCEGSQNCVPTHSPSQTSCADIGGKCKDVVLSIEENTCDVGLQTDKGRMDCGPDHTKTCCTVIPGKGWGEQCKKMGGACAPRGQCYPFESDEGPQDCSTDESTTCCVYNAPKCDQLEGECVPAEYGCDPSTKQTSQGQQDCSKDNSHICCAEKVITPTPVMTATSVPSPTQITTPTQIPQPSQVIVPTQIPVPTATPIPNTGNPVSNSFGALIQFFLLIIGFFFSLFIGGR